jgi:hypothetical protein
MPQAQQARAVDAMAREVDEFLEIVQRLQGTILERHIDVTEALIPVARKLAKARDTLADLVIEVGKATPDRESPIS